MAISRAGLSRSQAKTYLKKLKGWVLNLDGKSIHRQLLMKDFSAAVKLIQRIAVVANAQDHHPDIHLTNYRKLMIELSTHSIGGLSENDFIMAAKIEKLPKALKV